MNHIIGYNYYLELWINFVSASVKGHPLYKGQKARFQCVRYSEVPLYYYLYLEPCHTVRISNSVCYYNVDCCSGYCECMHTFIHHNC